MFIDALGHRVHTVAFGAGERTIVGISGAFGDWEIWQQPFEALSARHRVVAYDHLGTGLTHVPASAVTFDNQVACCIGLLDALEVDRCVLAGDSNMVAVAVEVAARHPDRVTALALVAGGVVHEPDDTIRSFVDGLRTDLDATVDAFVRFCLPEPDSEHLRTWLSEIIRRTGGERAAVLVESFYGIDVSHRLADLTMPVTIVQGAADVMPTSSVAGAERMAAAIADCRLVVLPDVGHVPTFSRPDVVVEALDDLAGRARW